MKILQVTPFFGEQLGGTERFSANISTILSERGHDVHVYTSRLLPTSPEYEEIDGVKVHRFFTAKVVWRINPLTFMFRKLLAANYDIIHVHSHLYFPSNQVFLAKLLKSPLASYPPIVLHLHGGVGDPPRRSIAPYKLVLKQFFDRSLGSLSVRAAKRIIAQSESVKKEALLHYNFLSKKIQTIPIAIDTTQFQKLNRSKAHNNHLIFVGDLESWKGVQTLIKVMKLLRQQNEDFSLRLVGSGSLESDLKKSADGLDIKFYGQKSHDIIPDLMSESFACILPSLWEAIPTVGLEAMASGVPFIGTDVGGIPEIIDHGKTGLLVKPNAPEEIVKAILTLKDENTWLKLRRQALEHVTAKHDITTMVTQIEEVYKNVVRRYG